MDSAKQVENKRRMQVSESNEWVSDSRVLLAAPEWQKNKGICKYCKCDRYAEGCIIIHVLKLPTAVPSAINIPIYCLLND
jgi:hypothetical protein